MKSKLLLFYWLCTYVTFCQAICSDYSEVLNTSIEYIRNNIGPKQIVIISKTSYQSNLVPPMFAKKLTEEFSSINIDIDEPANSRSSHVSQENWSLVQRCNRKNLNVIFMYGTQRKNIINELTSWINLTVEFPVPPKRAKCLIYLINAGSKIDFLDFFKLSWTRKFLDITVIEMQRQLGSDFLLSTANFTGISAHHYNPFVGTYEAENVSSRTVFFPDKLQNLYGTSLNTGFYTGTAHLYYTGGAEKYHGLDSIGGTLARISKTLAKTSNFSIHINAPDDSGKLVEAILKDKVDFTMNSFYPTNEAIVTYPFEMSSLINRKGNHLIVKQRPKYVARFGRTSVFVFGIFMVILALFAAMVRMLKLNAEAWSIYNISHIILGNSVSHEFKSVVERIIYMILIYVFISFSTNLTDFFIHINFHQEQYIKFETLQDAVTANVRACLNSNFSAGELEYYSSEELNWLMENQVEHCKKPFPSFLVENDENKISYDTFETNAVFAKLFSSLFSQNINGWIMSMVKEPLVPVYNFMLYSKISPYNHRFDAILQRLHESGLIKHWAKIDEDLLARQLRIDYKNYSTKKDFYDMQSKVATDTTIMNMRFYWNMIYLFLVGNLLAVTLFLVEISWFIQKKDRN